MARKFDPATFWKGIRLSEMQRLTRAYGLRIGEVNYLRRRIIDEPCVSDFDRRVIAFLDDLARDVCTFFHMKRLDDQRFKDIVTDEHRQAVRAEIWATIRRERATPTDIKPYQVQLPDHRIETMH